MRLGAQGDLRIGQWSAHLPYNGGATVTQSDTRIYYGTQYALMAISKADTSDVQFYSKVDGLSDTGPSWIRFHHGLNTLIVGYKDGNIDLLDSNGVTNVNDILRNTSIQGDKQITRIYTDDGPLAYLCTPFGLVILDITTGRFTSTVFTGSPALGFEKFQNKFFLAVENGLYAYDPSSGGLIEDFGHWTRVDWQLPSTYSCQAVSVFDNTLYAGINHELYRLSQDTMKSIFSKPGYSLQFISNEGQNLMVGYLCDAECAGQVYFFRPPGIFWHENGIFCAGRPSYAIEDEKGRVWYADMFAIFPLAQNHFASCDILHYDTPYSGNVSELEVKNGVLYVATGGVSESYDYQPNTDGFYTFDRMHWKTYNQFNTPEIAATGLLNFFRILPDPFSNKLYVGTYWGGLLEYDGSTYKVYNHTNSSLQGAVGDE
ncbi:MAG TPA: hypothetical protein VJ508_17835, partial [Saprospiraceae bacterium]|nr:hypothetical protein [Saprospiraceae bacterium]